MGEISKQLSGTGVALATPFDKNGNVDYTGLEKLINHVSEGGVDYLVVLGTTGESATLTKNEKQEVLAFVKDKNNKQLPLILGIGGNDTQNVLNDIADTDFKGVDGILSVCPYYNKPSQKGLLRHFTLIANKSPVPVILYNVPGRTGCNMTASTTVELAQNANIAGIKEASDNFYQFAEIIKHKPADFLLIAGDDMSTLPVLSVGGSGVISVLANGLPGVFSSMVNAASDNRFDEASRILMHILEINNFMYEESNPVGIKELLYQKGICDKYVRMPLLPASDDLAEKITKGMQKAGF